MKFLIITKIPPKQGLLGTVPEKYTVDETEAESVEAVKEGLHIPLGGWCKIVNVEDVTTFSPRIVYEERSS